MFTDIKRQSWTAEEYHAYAALSNSKLKMLQDDPLLLYLYEQGKFERPINSAMNLGSAFDDFLLSPDTEWKKWTVYDDLSLPTSDMQIAFAKLVVDGVDAVEAHPRAGYKRTSEAIATSLLEELSSYIEFSKDSHGLTRDQMDTIELMAESVWNHDAGRGVVENSEHQVCYTGVHEATGVEVKGMIDCLQEDREVDLKSTSSKWDQIVKPWWMRDRGYDTQRAMYCALSGREQTGLLVVRTEKRHRARCFDVTGHLTDATHKLDRMIREYAWRKKTGNWEHSPMYYTNFGWEVI